MTVWILCVGTFFPCRNTCRDFVHSHNPLICKYI
jgi:hypothetical protein